jgi:hypothetical protein
MPAGRHLGAARVALRASERRGADHKNGGDHRDYTRSHGRTFYVCCAGERKAGGPVPAPCPPAQSAALIRSLTIDIPDLRCCSSSRSRRCGCACRC